MSEKLKDLDAISSALGTTLLYVLTAADALGDDEPGNKITLDNLMTAYAKVNGRDGDVLIVNGGAGAAQFDLKAQGNANWWRIQALASGTTAHITSMNTAATPLEWNSTGDVTSGRDLTIVRNLNAAALPTSDPAIAGRFWRSGNDVKISTG